MKIEFHEFLGSKSETQPQTKEMLSIVSHGKNYNIRFIGKEELDKQQKLSKNKQHSTFTSELIYIAKQTGKTYYK